MANRCTPTAITARAGCEVVAIRLRANGLVGTLDSSLCTLDRLQVLDVAGNDLSGGLPSASGCFDDLEVLDLKDNHIDGAIPLWLITVVAGKGQQFLYLNLRGLSLEYPSEADVEQMLQMEELIKKCNSERTLNCEGLPPETCDAFRSDGGYTYKPRTDANDKCVECGDIVGPLVLLSAMFLLMFIGIFVYVWLIATYGQDFLRRWVSTVAILLNHVQTVGIIGNLTIDWPPSVIWITTAVSGNFLDLSFVRPECLLQGALDEASPYYVFTLGACGVILVTFVTLLLTEYSIRYVFAHCLSRTHASKAVDSVIFFNSIIYSTQLTPTWQITVQLFTTGFSGEDIGYIGLFMALFLLFMDVWLFLYYYFGVRKIDRARKEEERLADEMAAPRVDWLTQQEVPRASHGPAGFALTSGAQPRVITLGGSGGLSSFLHGGSGGRLLSFNRFGGADGGSGGRLLSFNRFGGQRAMPGGPAHTLTGGSGGVGGIQGGGRSGFGVDGDASDEPRREGHGQVVGQLVGGVELSGGASMLRQPPRTPPPSPPSLAHAGRIAPNSVLVTLSEEDNVARPHSVYSRVAKGVTGACASCSLCRSPPIDEDMEYRLSYLTDRFSHKEPSWQFVIWLRQALLFADATVGRSLLTGGFASVLFGGGATNSTATNSAAADIVAVNATNVSASALSACAEVAPVANIDTQRLVALWGHTLVAIITLLIFWWRHTKRHPYEYAFQNSIESWLYFANVIIISLGAVYTIFGTAHISAGVRCVFQPIVEVAMVVILVGSCLGAALYALPPIPPVASPHLTSLGATWQVPRLRLLGQYPARGPLGPYRRRHARRCWQERQECRRKERARRQGWHRRRSLAPAHGAAAGRRGEAKGQGGGAVALPASRQQAAGEQETDRRWRPARDGRVGLGRGRRHRRATPAAQSAWDAPPNKGPRTCSRGRQCHPSSSARWMASSADVLLTAHGGGDTDACDRRKPSSRCDHSGAPATKPL